jgi:succinyl-CoA synthetase alpha subunit
MQVSRDVGAREGVTAVLVAMATPLNLELAAGMGLAPAEGASPDQLLVAVSAVDDDALAAAVAAVDTALAARERAAGPAQAVPLRTVGAGLGALDGDGPALAVVSVPGPYAVAEAADAIAAGHSVLVFSDGVPVEARGRAQARRARRRGARHGPRLRDGDRLRPRARLRQRGPPRPGRAGRCVGHRRPAGLLSARHGRRRGLARPRRRRP